MQQTLATIVGPEAEGLSANVVSRLKHKWENEYADWTHRHITGGWVYIWADSIYSHLRGDDGKLVIIGVDSFGKKRFLVIEDGFREPTQSWREVLLPLKSRGLTKALKLAMLHFMIFGWQKIGRMQRNLSRTFLLAFPLNTPKLLSAWRKTSKSSFVSTTSRQNTGATQILLTL